MWSWPAVCAATKLQGTASYNRFARNTIGPARVNTDATPPRRGHGIEIDPLYCDVTIRRCDCSLEAIFEGAGNHFRTSTPNVPNRVES